MARFIVDEQLSPLLARRLTGLGHEAVHVRELGLGSTPDFEIARVAANRGAILISKDADFVALRQSGRLACPLLWLRLGNRSTAAIWGVLAPRLDEIIQVFDSGGDFYEVHGNLRLIIANPP